MGKYKKHKKPGIYYCNSSKKLANSESIDFLQKESLRINKKIVRLCLHNNESSELMSMLILVRDFYIFPPHRHDWKDESYYRPMTNDPNQNNVINDIYFNLNNFKSTVQSLYMGDFDIK